MDSTLYRLPCPWLLPAARRCAVPAAALALAVWLPAHAQSPSPPAAKGAAAASMRPGPRVQTLSKCTGADGRITYSDSACPAGTRGAALQVAPDTNVVDSPPLPSASTFAPPLPPAPSIAPQPYLPPLPNAGMPTRQAADCALLDRRAATLDGRAQQPPIADNAQLLPKEQRSLEDLRQHLGCE